MAFVPYFILSIESEGQAHHWSRNSRMLKTYFLDVRAGDRTLSRFDVRFALDEEAIQHCKELAATIRHRHFNNHPGLLIEVIDPSSPTIHKEIVYPEEPHEPDQEL